MSRRISPGRVLGATALAAAIGAVAAPTAVVRRWVSRDEPVFDFGFDGEHRTIETPDGAEIHVVVGGEGPTVVLGHGIAGDHTHWAPVARSLVADGYRAVIFDQRGHGTSTVGTLGCTTSGLATDLACVIADYGSDDTIVVGHSMGGVGVQALLRHRRDAFDKVQRVVIVASLPHTIRGSVASVVGNPLVLRAFRALMRRSTSARLAMRPGFGQRFSVAMLDHLAGTWDDTPDATLLGFGDALSDFSFVADLGSCPVPARVVCGAADTITPIGLSRLIDDALPDSELTELPGVGHMILWESVDELADVITA